MRRFVLVLVLAAVGLSLVAANTGTADAEWASRIRRECIRSGPYGDPYIGGILGTIAEYNPTANASQGRATSFGTVNIYARPTPQLYIVHSCTYVIETYWVGPSCFGPYRWRCR